MEPDIVDAFKGVKVDGQALFNMEPNTLFKEMRRCSTCSALCSMLTISYAAYSVLSCCMGNAEIACEKNDI